MTWRPRVVATAGGYAFGIAHSVGSPNSMDTGADGFQNVRLLHAATDGLCARIG